MSIKDELLKKLVVAAGLKRQCLSSTTEELLENRRKQNKKNRIPVLKDETFEFSRIDVNGFPVLKLIHKEHAGRANLFLIGGEGMFHCYADYMKRVNRCIPRPPRYI